MTDHSNGNHFTLSEASAAAVAVTAAAAAAAGEEKIALWFSARTGNCTISRNYSDSAGFAGETYCTVTQLPCHLEHWVSAVQPHQARQINACLIINKLINLSGFCLLMLQIIWFLSFFSGFAVKVWCRMLYYPEFKNRTEPFAVY